MECGSELRELASHNSFVQALEADGYLLDFVGGHFVIYGLPCLDADGQLTHGDWTSPVDLSGWVIDPPGDHQAWFRGVRPHARDGRRLRLGGGTETKVIAEGFVTTERFSYKINEGGTLRPYRSFEEKVLTYMETIVGPAMAAYPDATPFRAIADRAQAQGTPLKFPDTLSARYDMNDLSMLLNGKRVAIVGLGGTGSYILDFLARTHLAEIVLYDDDKVHIHTLFRMPGFIANAVGATKVEALAQQYGNWHGAISPIPERVTEENVEQLRGVDFVFLSIDNGPGRIFLTDWLSANGIAFVDCGMGLNRTKGGLNGAVRITGVDRAAFEQTQKTVHLPGGDPEADQYRRQAQIAELNALNATLAVIRFKQHFGLYDWEDDAPSYIFETTSFALEPLARRP
jgi:hypothetical protein